MRTNYSKPCKIERTTRVTSGHGEVEAETSIVDFLGGVVCTVPGFYDKPNLELAEKVLEALNK